ncbi:hypothetical protein CsSME_00013697 [Camellia sinensis var. sinensis]
MNRGSKTDRESEGNNANEERDDRCAKKMVGVQSNSGLSTHAISSYEMELKN